MKEKDEWINMSNYLIKQGNSFCVRIPGKVVKDMNAEKGDAVAIRIKKFRPELTDGALEAYYNLARKKKALDSFSREKIIVMSTLVFNEGELINKINGGKQMRNIAEGKQMLNAMNKHREKIKKEFGEKFYKDYEFFVKSISENFTITPINPKKKP